MDRFAIRRPSGFSLAEAVIGIGLATVLILTIMALTTAALSGDQKAEMKQVALAVANSELNALNRAVSVAGSSARNDFWGAADGTYAGAGTRSQLISNGTIFELVYRVSTVRNSLTGTDLGREKAGNRLRKVDLTLSWWNGDKGKPGYGQLFLTTTRLVRESDLRE